jgi:hypothetical protein
MLIIDPIIIGYSTFLGGVANDGSNGIAVENGSIYISGHTKSSNFPLANAIDTTFNGTQDCFVAKFSADRQSLVYSTFLGGTNTDTSQSIAVENGFAYITGNTYSDDFPVANAYNSTYGGAGGDAFVTKLSADGQSLVFSTYLGGISTDNGNDIAVENGYTYVTGYTQSINFPVASAYDPTLNGYLDCFLTKFNTDGQTLVYSTHLGGSEYDYAYGIDVEDGYVYLTGKTDSANFPTIDAYDSTHNGNDDGFITKFATDGASLVYSTFFGGSSYEYSWSIAVENGYAFATGQTKSTNFPVENAYDSTHNGNEDCFVIKLSKLGDSLGYSTYLGGANNDFGFDIEVVNGYAYVTGYTYSTEFPIANAFNVTHEGASDCFVTKFDEDGLALVYSTFLGGAGYDAGNDIDVENNTAYVAGTTQSTNFPIEDAFDSTFNGGYDCFIAHLLEDLDYDGLPDLYEVLIGTNPYMIDTDNDNFLDGYEVAYGSDPLNPMSYPAMPQAWYDSIYDNLEGNATLIQNLITWSDGNASLLQTVMQQLDANATLLSQVIAWLDDNHTEIETMFTHLAGNATLLIKTINALNGNVTLIQNLLSWSGGNSTLLQITIQQLDANATLLTQVITWLDGNHTTIETLYTFVEGNATVLMEVVNALDGNSTQLELVTAIATQNAEWLSQFNTTMIDNITLIREVLDQLGVTVGDTDYDGLDDLDEISIGTDIQRIDTDNDNLIDAFELKIGTDPLDDDTDGDTYFDGFEVLSGTDPLNSADYPGVTTTEPTTTSSTTTAATSPTTTTTTPPDMTILYITLGAGTTVIIILVVILFMKKRVRT